MLQFQFSSSTDILSADLAEPVTYFVDDFTLEGLLRVVLRGECLLKVLEDVQGEGGIRDFVDILRLQGTQRSLHFPQLGVRKVALVGGETYISSFNFEDSIIPKNLLTSDKPINTKPHHIMPVYI